MKKKAFTLIELIAVLVILAILALIVTPLVMNIIRKARIAADKRSIDAYGRSIELAIATYLLDHGDFPTSVNDLTIEYSGDEVACSTTQLNSDSSVYLADCRVAGRSVDYTYGKESNITYNAYELGDEVSYNNVDYYVLKDSGTNDATVTLLKATPITSSEINSYLSSTEVASKVDTSGTYIEMAYLSTEECVSAGNTSGCSTEYGVSDIKQVVDVWKTNYAVGAITARLLENDDLEQLGYEWGELTPSDFFWIKTDSVPSWFYSNNNEYLYWTQIPREDDGIGVWYVDKNGKFYYGQVYRNVYKGGAVRPVITINKAELID